MHRISHPAPKALETAITQALGLGTGAESLLYALRPLSGNRFLTHQTSKGMQVWQWQEDKPVPLSIPLDASPLWGIEAELPGGRLLLRHDNSLYVCKPGETVAPQLLLEGRFLGCISNPVAPEVAQIAVRSRDLSCIQLFNVDARRVVQTSFLNDRIPRAICGEASTQNYLLCSASGSLIDLYPKITLAIADVLAGLPIDSTALASPRSLIAYHRCRFLSKDWVVAEVTGGRTTLGFFNLAQQVSLPRETKNEESPVFLDGFSYIKDYAVSSDCLHVLGKRSGDSRESIQIWRCDVRGARPVLDPLEIIFLEQGADRLACMEDGSLLCYFVRERPMIGNIHLRRIIPTYPAAHAHRRTALPRVLEEGATVKRDHGYPFVLGGLVAGYEGGYPGCLFSSSATQSRSTIQPSSVPRSTPPALPPPSAVPGLRKP